MEITVPAARNQIFTFFKLFKEFIVEEVIASQAR
jgi:hypothetical protein